MKLLVTGGAGFIGSNFVRYWRKHHPADAITVLDKLTYAGSLDNLADLKDQFRFIQGDIVDETVVAKAMAEVDTVVHFAAETHVDRSVADPDVFVRTNVLGTHVLLHQAVKNKLKRFHHVSTDEVYGQLPLGTSERWTENSPYAPRSPYSASKAASDHLVRAYHQTYGLPITITNCANNIGPYMFPEKLLPLAITNVLAGKKVPVYEPGNQVREWLYVEDHCSAIEAVLARGRAGETYFVGPDNPELPNLEIIKKVLALLGKDETWIELVKDRPGHDQRYALDCSKIKQELGWAPRFNLADSLRLTVEWFQNNEAWWKQRKNQNFQK